MAKVIVERPRIGGHGRRKGRDQPLDALPTKEGMKRGHGDHKMLNENLQPLRRYLHKQVGRPWNKVYADLSKHVRVDNPVQQHVRDHVWQEVERHVVFDAEGRPCAKREFRNGILPLRPGELYVAPHTGLLCRVPEPPKQPEPHWFLAKWGVPKARCAACDSTDRIRVLWIRRTLRINLCRTCRHGIGAALREST
jgi:hypothetical protein